MDIRTGWIETKHPCSNIKLLIISRNVYESNNRFKKNAILHNTIYYMPLDVEQFPSNKLLTNHHSFAQKHIWTSMGNWKGLNETKFSQQSLQRMTKTVKCECSWEQPIGGLTVQVEWLVWRLAATWHWPTFIRQTARTHLMTVSWWEHHKHCLKYYYYLVQQYFITKLSSGWHCLIAQLTKSFLASLQLDYMTYQTVWSLLVTNVSTLGRPLLLQYLTPYPFTGDSWQMWN